MDLDDLLDLCKAYSDLGSAVQEQLHTLVDHGEHADPEFPPCRLRLGHFARNEGPLRYRLRLHQNHRPQRCPSLALPPDPHGG